MNFPDSNEPAWFCVRCQPKREHIAAAGLRGLEEIEVFCPRLRYRKATRRGKIWWVEPMFPGYLLAKFDLMTKKRIITHTQGVMGIVHFGSQVPPVPQSFVETLQREVLERDGGSELITLKPDVQIGDAVEVSEGPLRGIQATVISLPSAAERVQILMEFLGQPQAVEVDLFSLLLPRKPKV